jgi:hypothetical protein
VSIGVCFPFFLFLLFAASISVSISTSFAASGCRFARLELLPYN